MLRSCRPLVLLHQLALALLVFLALLSRDGAFSSLRIVKGLQATISSSTRLPAASTSFSSWLRLLQPFPSASSTSSSKGLERADTVILGAGLAGLACATELIRGGYTGKIRLLEAGDRPGGRVRTDVHPDGYLLDRGFQVFIDTYPEAQTLFAPLGGCQKSLDLQPFLPGALVRFGGEFHTVSDPLRRPQDLLKSINTPIGSFVDKAVVGLYSVYSRFVQQVDDLSKIEESTTLSLLEDSLRLSPAMIDRFFAPFFQGIFLSPLSKQSSRMFAFVFKMFASGSACLPRAGMGRVAEELASTLPAGVIAYNTRATSLTRKNSRVTAGFIVDATADGGSQKLKIECSNVVLAVDPEAAGQLLSAKGDAAGSGLNQKQVQMDLQIPEGRGSLCLYYGFDGAPPVEQALLILNGDNNNLATGAAPAIVAAVNNVCFPSQVSRDYAPPGKSLASVTVVDPRALSLSDQELDTCVRSQLQQWWPTASCEQWHLLRVYRIPYAQPAQTPPYDLQRSSKLDEGLYISGDHRNTATLNGAIASGRIVGRQILAK